MGVNDIGVQGKRRAPSDGEALRRLARALIQLAEVQLATEATACRRSSEGSVPRRQAAARPGEQAA